MEEEVENLPALLCNGTHAEIIVRAPLTIPEPPIPATALPTMSIFDDVATPQSNEPNSKVATNAEKVYCRDIRN